MNEQKNRYNILVNTATKLGVTPYELQYYFDTGYRFKTDPRRHKYQADSRHYNTHDYNLDIGTEYDGD